MPIFQVEIFTPRRMTVLRVVKKVHQSASSDSDAVNEDAPIIETDAHASPTSATTTCIGQNTKFLSSVTEKAEDVEGLPVGIEPTSTANNADEERTEKLNATNDETFEVVFRVERMTRANQDESEEQIEGDDERSSAAGNGGGAQAIPNASVVGSGTTSNPPPPADDVITLDLEEELRVLLLDCIPGVRTIWNRCNSLKNVGEKAEDHVQSFLQVTFYARRRTSLHILSRVMNEIGIGKDYGHVSMTECSYFRPIIGNAKAAMDQELDDATIDHIQAQLAFDHTLQVIDAGASLTFDFVAFLLIASIIAGTGLGVNSTVSVVAAMLVSPMMGPILATVMGTVLYLRQYVSGNTAGRDVHLVGRRLLIKGFIAECFCLFIGTCVGFVVGLAFWNNTDTFNWGSQGTEEMLARTSLPGLMVGVVTAIPSGAGVALSLLGSNGNSLVGVAIAASLLPPAVNCGMYFAFAIIARDTELLRLGAYSQCLTLINVVCVFVAALGTFYIKRAAPLTDAQGRPLTSFFGIPDFDAVTQNNAVEEVERDLHRHGLTLRGLVAKLDNEAKTNNDVTTSPAAARPSAGTPTESFEAKTKMRRIRSELRVETNPSDHEPLATPSLRFPSTPHHCGLRQTTNRGVSEGNVFGVGGLDSSVRVGGGAARPIQGLPLYFIDDVDDDEPIAPPQQQRRSDAGRHLRTRSAFK
jgi:hypothetical protein